LRINASKKRRRMLRVLNYNKELETEKLMKEKEQKLREPPRGWAPTTSRPKRKEDHNEVGPGAKPRSCSWYRTWLMTTSS